MKNYDVAIIGSGPGGYVAAIRLAQYGKKVVVIEKERVGGVCLNVGCIPSKALIHASQVYDSIAKAGEFGVTVEGLRLDAGKLQSWKNDVVKKLTGGIAQLLKARKVELIAGEATFKTPKSLVVTKGNETEEIGFEQAIIATGSQPASLKGFAFDGDLVGSSTDGLNYSKIPEKLCVIGGGYIGLELGSLYTALGAEVTVVEATETLLPGTDPELVKVVAKELAKRNVKFHLKTFATSVQKKSGKAEVTLKTPEGEVVGSFDKVLVAVGRVPNTKNLGIEALGIICDPKGFIRVNERQQTNVAGIYAIGDCAGGVLLAHKASKEGLVAAAVITGQEEIFDVWGMPAVIFTNPEIAYVGKDEAQAKAAGYEVKIGRFPFVASGKALATGHTEGLVKIITDAKSDLVLGIFIVGHEASSLIGEACLAIEMGATAEDIARTVHPHPTLTETLMEAAEAVHNKAIHIFQR